MSTRLEKMSAKLRGNISRQRFQRSSQHRNNEWSTYLGLLPSAIIDSFRDIRCSTNSDFGGEVSIIANFLLGNETLMQMLLTILEVKITGCKIKLTLVDGRFYSRRGFSRIMVWGSGNESQFC